MTALSAAQADPGRLAAALERPAVSEPAAATPPAVTADASAGLAFVRPDVSSTSAPAPSTKVQSAGAVPAPATPKPDTSKAAAPKGLRAPLASMTVSSPFGYRFNPLTGASGELHTGMDVPAPANTPVSAAGAGTVTEAGWSQFGGGNRIVVDHGNGLKTTYNHLATIGVSVGQVLAQGAQIAGVGTTGNSTGNHLHFEVMVNDQVVNPATFI
ncbi:M23 family metallopeptidase [Micrococcaceae bacterium Sec5.7]